MRCLYPRTVGFHSDGKTLSWSPKNFNKEHPAFQLPCGKCLECRLEYARQWAVRCVHESKMHEDNVFITLTYSDENLKSDRLQYVDFQLFVKRLRDYIFREFMSNFGTENWKILTKSEKKLHYDKIRISVFATGEYGDQTKRPHWHAIIFNWSPNDIKYTHTTDNGDKVYRSDLLDDLWGKNDRTSRPNQIGTVTFQSAGYVARYAAKKLVHGKDQNHNYHPISKKSSKRAIGRSFLEKFWPDVFRYGHVILDNGTKCSIPRYYEKWLKEHQPDAYEKYITKRKNEAVQAAQQKSEKEKQEYLDQNSKRKWNNSLITRQEVRSTILKDKFKKLQTYLKGDI